MNRKVWMLALAILIAAVQLAAGQGQKATIYNPSADAEAEIAKAVKKAKAEGKHVLLQVGGNWCSWCIKFHQLTTTDAQLDSTLKADYVVVKVNHSKENKNLPLLAKLGYPQRFGFPVFVVLNEKGERLHTQNSVYLEEGRGYSKKKIQEFLLQWSPAALKPESYSQ